MLAFNIIISLLLLSIVNGEVDCKAVEWEVTVSTGLWSTATLNKAFPVDVCYSWSLEASYGSSEGSVEYGAWVYCTDTGEAWAAVYADADCEVYPIFQSTFEDFQVTCNSETMVSVNVYCEKTACDYITVKTSTQATTNCTNPDAASFGFYTSQPFIADRCNYVDGTWVDASEIWTCSNDIATHSYYSGVTDCSGIFVYCMRFCV